MTQTHQSRRLDLTKRMQRTYLAHLFQLHDLFLKSGYHARRTLKLMGKVPDKLVS